MPLPRLLRQCLSLPTAPFREEHVLAFVRATCEPLRNVKIEEDRWGNVIAHYRSGSGQKRPPLFAAHTDHPGFIVQKANGDGTFTADFRGGVERSFFDGAAARFFVDGTWHTTPIVKVETVEKVRRGNRTYVRPGAVRFAASDSIPLESIGMWDLPDPVERDGNVHARACDDLAGVAALLALLQRTADKGHKTQFSCLFSRGEEVGFIGAIGACKAKSLPPNAYVIVVETSSALPHVKIQDGPIIRVGDKSSVFSPAVTGFCERIAQQRANLRKSFRFQRKLMDGGTCEATAFNALGFEATCICLALGNYHNMNRATGKIDSEYVSIADWRAMVDLFEAIVVHADQFSASTAKDASSYDALFKKYRGLL